MARRSPLLVAAALALLAIACGSGASGQQPAPGTTTPRPTIDPAWLAPNLVKDNPTATPTPAPAHEILPHCFWETTGVENWRPASENSFLRHCQLVAFYGYPAIPGLGVLGQNAPEDMALRLAIQAEAYDNLNGPIDVVSTLHIITAVAQGGPTPDGTYLVRIDAATLDSYIALAEKHDFLVILDLQMGTSTVDAEFSHVAKYLENPRVHLAVDPEWAMPDGVTPGTIIGSMDGAEINRAQELLQALVDEHNLPNKILVVHQFRHDMITNKPAITDFPGVDLIIDQDGFGFSGAKNGNYDVFVRQDQAEFGGMKLFYTEDFDLMSPAQVLGLDPVPALVVYQ